MNPGLWAALDGAGRRGPSPRRRALLRHVSSNPLRFLAALLFAAGVATSARATTDSTRVHVELGWRTDASNELYYEQTFDDTTFRPASLRSTPEVLNAFVGRADWGHLDEPRRAPWRFGGEARLGDRLNEVAVDGRVHAADMAGWELTATPRVAWQHDRTFDRNRREWRARSGFQAWRTSTDEESRLGLRGALDVLRGDGAGSEYLPDHDVASLAVAFERLPWVGPEWRFECGVEGRQFPDSVMRDHLEQHADASVRRDAGIGSLEMGGRVVRRNTLRDALSSRDRYWLTSASAEARATLAPHWALHLRVEGEHQSYDRPDSTLYFDYSLVRGEFAPRFESGEWSLELGPRLEWLHAPVNPAESYLEPAVAAELEWLSGGALWTLSPAVGRREYDDSTGDPLALHTSFDFLEGHLIADQALPAGLRLRAFAYGRLERHADSTQDARSLYFSLDVRRLF